MSTREACGESAAVKPSIFLWKSQLAGLAVDFRTGIAAGSPIPIDLMKQLIEKLNLTELTVAYGMSASGNMGDRCMESLTSTFFFASQRRLGMRRLH